MDTEILGAVERLITSAALADHAGDYMGELEVLARLLKAKNIPTPYIDEIYSDDGDGLVGLDSLLARFDDE